MFIKLLISCFLLFGIRANPEIVKTPLGRIAGFRKNSRNGRPFLSFEGIPYAEPPIGFNGRFEPPEPVKPWDGIWNASYVTTCAQYGILGYDSIDGEEDCLHLNIFVPRKSINQNDNLDVVVYIHGGAYMFGASHSFVTPSHFMDKDIVFVSINYRLNLFGFLSTEDKIVPGNMGLKDQVLALKWIKQNILYFGGNPNSVTITGISAGAGSVHLHYLFKQSKGLFHKGFSISGTALNIWNFQKEALSKAKKLGHAVGCDTDNTQTVINCLKQRPYKQILSKLNLFYGYEFYPITAFGPVVEIEHNGAVITQHPFELLKKGLVHDYPWMVSMTSHEGYFMVQYFGDVEDVDKNWNTLAPFLLDYNHTLPQTLWNEAGQKIREFYLSKKSLQDDPLSASKIFSDRYFLVDGEVALRLHAGANKSPVYYFVMSYSGNKTQDVVIHSEDSKYYLGGTFFNAKETFTDDEIKMSEVLQNVLVSFAKTGVPKIEDVDWKPVKDNEVNYLNIGGFTKDKITQHSSSDEVTPIKFWDSLNFAEGKNVVAKTKDEL